MTVDIVSSVESGAGEVDRVASWPLTIALSTLVMVAFGTMLYAFSVFVTADAAGAEFSVSVLSVAWTGTVLVGGGLAFVVGRVADQRGLRVVMGLGAVVGAAGLGAMGLAHEPWQVIVAAWFLIGPASAMTFYEPAFIAVDQWFPVDRRATTLAALTVIGGLAGPIFLPLTGMLIDPLGWRATAFVLAGVLLAVGLTASVLFFPSGSVGTRAPHSLGEDRTVKALFRDRRFVFFTAATLLSFASLQGIIFHRIAVFEEASFPVAVVATWAGITGLLSLPGRWISPYAANRVNPIRLSALVNVVLVVAVVVAVIAATWWQMATHFVLFGIAFGALLPLRAVVMSRWYTGPGFGRVMGTQWAVVGTVAAAGPLMMGLIRDGVGSYTVPLAIVAVLLAGAAVFTWFAEPRATIWNRRTAEHSSTRVR